MSAGVSAYRSGGVMLRPRDSGEFADLALTGLRAVPPGVVLVSDWRPEGDCPHPSAAEVATYGVVGYKPLLSGGEAGHVLDVWAVVVRSGK